MKHKLILKNGSTLLIYKVGTVMLSMLNLMILSRIFTTEQMGTYSLYMMVVNFALILGLNWSDTSIVRHGKEELVKTGKINQSFWARTHICLPVFGLFLSIFSLFSEELSIYIGIDEWLIVTVISLFVFNGVFNYLKNIYMTLDNVRGAACLPLLQKMFYCIGLLLIYLELLQPNIAMVLALINISFLFPLFVSIVNFNFSSILPYSFNGVYLKKIWSFSWPQLIGFSGLYIINYVDLYMINKYLTIRDVGVYNVAYTGFLTLMGFVMLIDTITLPLMVEYRVKNRTDSVKRYLFMVPIMSLFWVVIVILGVYVSGDVVPLLFSNKYIEAVPSFNILLVASIFSFVSTCLKPLMNAYDYVLQLQIFNLISCAVNVFADYLFVPTLGIVGAAYGTLLSYVVALFLLFIFLMVKKKSIFRLVVNG